MAAAEVGALRITLGMDNAEFAEGAKEAERLIDRLANRIGITAGAAAAAGTIIGNILTGAFESLTASIRETIGGVTEAIDKAEAMADAAEKTGVSIETISAIVKEGEVSMSALTSALAGLEQGLVKAGQGDATATATRAFRALGISAVDASGNVRKTEDVLDEIADKFAQYQDGAAKNAIATYLFGDANKQLITVLNKGSDGLEDLIEDHQKLGGALDAVSGRQAQDYKDTMEEMQRTTDIFYTQLAIKLLPTIKSFSEVLRDWVNGPAEDAAPAASKIANAINSIYVMTLEAGAGIQRLGIKLKAFWESGVALFTSDEVKKIQDEAADAVKKIDADLAARKAKLDEDRAGKAVEDDKTDEKKQAPLIASTKALSDVNREWNKSVSDGVTLAKAALTPYEKLGIQIDNLRDAYGAGKISADQLAIAQKKAIDEANIAFAGGAELIAKTTSPYEQMLVTLDKLREKYQAGAISAQAFGQAQLQANLVAVQAYASGASNIAGSLSQVFAKSKGVAIAAAIINSFQAASNALAQVPYPLNFAAAAAALAAGFVQVANIRRTTESSGGGGGGGGAAAAPGLTQAPQQLRVEGINPGSLFTGSAVKTLAQELLNFQRDGGQVVLA